MFALLHFFRTFLYCNGIELEEKSSERHKKIRNTVFYSELSHTHTHTNETRGYSTIFTHAKSVTSVFKSFSFVIYGAFNGLVVCVEKALVGKYLAFNKHVFWLNMSFHFPKNNKPKPVRFFPLSVFTIRVLGYV